MKRLFCLLMCLSCLLVSTANNVTKKKTVNVGEKKNVCVYSFGDCTIFRISNNTDASVVDATLQSTTKTSTLYLTGKKRGFSTVTISKWNNKYSRWDYDIYNVTVVDVITILIPQTVSVKIGDSYTFNPSILDSDASTTFTWYSSNPAVATIKQTGILTAKSVGTTTISCIAANGVTANCKVTVTPKMVSSISLNKTTLSLVTGNTFQLQATVSPSDAGNKKVTWKSSNPNVATVSSSGLVTAVASGSCTITATAADGSNVSASCAITVTPKKVSSISLNKTNLSLTAGDAFQLQATVSPSDAGNKNVMWKSSNPNVATVSSSGLVTAVASGSCTITATAADGSNVSASCTLTVSPKLITKITISPSECSLKENEQIQISATVTPFDATNKKLNWHSSNGQIATVNSNGLVTAVKAGTCNITAASTDGSNVVATCAITVEAATPIITGILLNAEHFPDANFRNSLAEILKISEGDKITDEMIAATTELIFRRGRAIKDLTGIGFFTALTILECCDNQLTFLDVSQNTALTQLYCTDNQLKSLDVSKNVALTTLWCQNNQLKILDVTKNAALMSLYCSTNELTMLDVKNNSRLTTLNCSENQLKALDISKCIALNELSCSNNQLVALDVSMNPKLNKLDCSVNQLTVLDVSKNTSLYGLYCSNNRLSSLNISGCTRLYELNCDGNTLSSLDLTTNANLTTLCCTNNQLSSLNVSRNIALYSLYCFSNQLTSLDVSNNTKLASLQCYDNKLTTLDLSECAALYDLTCFGNMIKGECMQRLVESLPIMKSGKFNVIDTKDENEKNVISKNQVKIAKEKGWTVRDKFGYNNYYDWIEYEGSEESYHVGDVTGDGSVSNNDVTILARYLKDWDGYADRIGNLSAADVNRDGEVKNNDVTLLARAVKGWTGYEKYLIVVQSAPMLLPSITATNTMTLEVDDVKVKTTDSEVKVPIRATKNDGFGSGIITIEWDKDKLELTNVEYSDFAPNNQSAAVSNKGTYKIAFGDDYATKNFTSTGTFFTLTFKIPTKSTSGKVDVKIVATDVQDCDVESVTVTTRNGSVTIEEETTFIHPVDSGELTDDSWYTIDGKKLAGEPKEKGIYIRNGRKVVK
ncbi:MAG: Ig-like domain-containing protein [Prevotella sp.]|nr:Ig-like domain-containing protein [Prevotella sp.]